MTWIPRHALREDGVTLHCFHLQKAVKPVERQTKTIRPNGTGPGWHGDRQADRDTEPARPAETVEKEG